MKHGRRDAAEVAVGGFSPAICGGLIEACARAARSASGTGVFPRDLRGPH